MFLFFFSFMLWEDLELGFPSRSTLIYTTLLKQCEENFLQANGSAFGIFSSSTV